MNNFFTLNENQIRFFSTGFKNWFEGVEVKIPADLKLYSKVLENTMLDKEILEELKPSELTLGEVAYAIKNLLKKEDWAVFYVRDNENVLRAVYVYWDSDVGGWHVSTRGVTRLRRWFGESRVFSRNPFDSVNLETSDTLEPKNLESRVKSLEKDMQKIKDLWK